MNSKTLLSVVIVCSIFIGLIVGMFSLKTIDVSSPNITTQNSGNIENIISDSGEKTSGDFIIESGNIEPIVSSPSIEPEQNVSGENTELEIIKKKMPVPENVQAVYATGWVMGTPGLRSKMISSLKEYGYNSIVIDIKDEAGHLTYNSSVQTAIDIKASQKMVSDISAILNELHENDLYVIGRIVTFKDPTYAGKVSDIAYQKADGTVWQDSAGNKWPNPYNKASWDYPIALAKEAAELGFDEIQFDYIRFPSSEGRVSQIAYGFEFGTKTKSDIIAEFLEKVMVELEPYDVQISADVFGIITKRNGDFENIGQDFSRIASMVDVICPMVYPSHYNFNEYGLAKPDTAPYSLIYHSINDALKRYNEYINKTYNVSISGDNFSGDTVIEKSELNYSDYHLAKIRPYLQDFTASWLGKGNYLSYGTTEVQAQIQAQYDLGINDFTLWDPSNNYCYSALKNVEGK